MSAKVELLVQVCINGRPIWRKAKTIRPELTYQMTDKEYAKVVDAATVELNAQIKDARPKEKVAAK